jgi:hypothetical protein
LEGNQRLCINEQWITEDGYYEKLRQYINSQNLSDKDKLRGKELLWLYIPDFNSQGIIKEIISVPDRKDPTKNMWEMDPDCSGLVISDKNCNLRIEEMELISYQPKECKTGEVPDCS